MNKLKKFLPSQNFPFSPGFTLIEVLVSSSLIMFLLLSITQLILYSLLVKNRTDWGRISSELASSKLEYFKSLSFENQELQEGTTEERLKEKNTHKIFKIKWKIKDLNESLKKVEIVCYPDSALSKKVELILYISKELGF